MTAAELLSFMREHWLAVQASVSMSGSAQAAAIGIVVTDDFEVFFDTVDESRKVENLRRNPRIAFVVGGTTAGDERSDVRSAPSRATRNSGRSRPRACVQAKGALAISPRSAQRDPQSATTKQRCASR